jgi:hypothetical protein
MNEWNAIPVSELLTDRPFTDPAHTAQDHAAMTFALDQLRILAHQPQWSPEPQWVEVAERKHRLIVIDQPALLTLPVLTLVGFFGQRRRDADTTPIHQVDGELVVELTEHPGLLSYCTLLLENGDYGNIVLFASEHAKLHWATSERHGYAVRTLSPKVYESVRLHNGYVPGGLLSGQPPVVERTKYLDYRGMLPWRGVREWQ